MAAGFSGESARFPDFYSCPSLPRGSRLGPAGTMLPTGGRTAPGRPERRTPTAVGGGAPDRAVRPIARPRVPGPRFLETPPVRTAPPVITLAAMAPENRVGRLGTRGSALGTRRRAATSGTAVPCVT